MKRIAVATGKGGSGKSTVTRALVGLVMQGKRVHVIDGDTTQWSLASWFTRRQAAQLPARSKGKLTVINSQRPAEEPVPKDVDFVLYDLPGRSDELVREVLVSVDLVVIPVRPAFDDSDALWLFLDQVQGAARARAVALPGFLVVNAARPDWKSTQQFIDDVGPVLPPTIKLLQSVLYEYADWNITRGNGMTPLEYRPQGPAARDQQHLIKELSKEVRLSA